MGASLAGESTSGGGIGKGAAWQAERLPYNIFAYRGHRKDYKASHKWFDMIVRGPRAARLHRDASTSNIGDSLPSGCLDL
jgi:hypothetical protein